ncbi:hypothetical protein NpNSSI1_00002257 [Neofusicoccum parvum]|uniref:Uncharacterized protein n=1 Tax=Neofusicoccum parvum TaxID=310453 RepID=A0ACB5RP97_9PEZI|nr:hypothetical protein NpPPO83_00010194 [Neofusicoccum parvum]GME48813.1 hypothetical protein NpNSSI1_00002257 [Neofusicoccum parvum]
MKLTLSMFTLMAATVVMAAPAPAPEAEAEADPQSFGFRPNNWGNNWNHRWGNRWGNRFTSDCNACYGTCPIQAQGAPPINPGCNQQCNYFVNPSCPACYDDWYLQQALVNCPADSPAGQRYGWQNNGGW